MNEKLEYSTLEDICQQIVGDSPEANDRERLLARLNECLISTLKNNAYFASDSYNGEITDSGETLISVLAAVNILTIFFESYDCEFSTNFRSNALFLLDSLQAPIEESSPSK